MMPFSLDSTDKQETDALCHSLKKVSFDHPTRTLTNKKRHCNFQLDKDGVEDAHVGCQGQFKRAPEDVIMRRKLVKAKIKLAKNRHAICDYTKPESWVLAPHAADGATESNGMCTVSKKTKFSFTHNCADKQSENISVPEHSHVFTPQTLERKVRVLQGFEKAMVPTDAKKNVGSKVGRTPHVFNATPSFVFGSAAQRPTKFDFTATLHDADRLPNLMSPPNDSGSVWDAFKLQPNEWRCAVCAVKNHTVNKKCVSCESLCDIATGKSIADDNDAHAPVKSAHTPVKSKPAPKSKAAPKTNDIYRKTNEVEKKEPPKSLDELLFQEVTVIFKVRAYVILVMNFRAAFTHGLFSG